MPVANQEVERAGAEQESKPREWTSGWPQTALEFEAFIDMFQDRLVRYAYCRLKDLGDAEDVVQDVFVKAYERRNELRDIRYVAPYLHRMVANLCTDRLRRPRPVLVPMEAIGFDEMPRSNAVAAQRLEAADQLRQAEALIARLPKRQAEVLRLRILSDLSLTEIAAMLECPLATVKSRLRYGIARLRGFLPSGKERRR